MIRQKAPSLLPFIGGVTGGVVYVTVAEKSIGKANCSWRDPLLTDIASMGIGSYLAWRGTVLHEPWIAAAGAAMLTVHIGQLIYGGSSNA